MCLGPDASVTTSLVTDRLTEFRRLARRSGALQPEGVGQATATGAGDMLGKVRLLPHKDAAAMLPGRSENEPSFMREFFEAVGEIQCTIKEGRGCVQQMDAMLEEMLRATTQDAQKAASDGLNQQVETTMGHISAAKRGLEALQRQLDLDKSKSSPAQRAIRANMQRALANKHQQLLLDFQKSQQSFKRALEQRQVRELHLLCPEATGEQLRQMVEAGETSSQMMVRKMAGAHASIVEEVQRIRDKHQDILRLEKSIADLAQMFQEIAILVDAQGEMLDSIETNVHSANEYTGKGAKELDKTLKIQHSTRKWQCCLSIFCLIVLLVALGPIIFR